MAGIARRSILDKASMDVTHGCSPLAGQGSGGEGDSRAWASEGRQDHHCIRGGPHRLQVRHITHTMAQHTAWHGTGHQHQLQHSTAWQSIRCRTARRSVQHSMTYSSRSSASLAGRPAWPTMQLTAATAAAVTNGNVCRLLTLLILKAEKCGMAWPHPAMASSSHRPTNFRPSLLFLQVGDHRAGGTHPRAHRTGGMAFHGTCSFMRYPAVPLLYSG